jgi:hypothetical protein
VLKRALSLVAAISLSACGGSGHTSAPIPPAAANASSSGARVTSSFIVTIPRAAAAASRGRAPRYVSASTQSLGITVDAGTANQTFTGQNIGPGDPGCNNPTPISPLTCTVNVSATPGPHTFDLRTYDQRLDGGGNPQGSILSTNIGFPFTVVAAQANVLRLVLQGIPSAVALLVQPNQDVRGDQTAGFDLYGAYKADGTTLFTRTFFAVATDADSNFIVGPGAPTMTVTSSNTGALSSGVASASNPNLFTVTPATYSANAPIQFTVTATPSTAANADSGAAPVSINVPVRYVARNAPRIYLSGGPSQSWIKVYDEFGNPVTVGGTFDGLSGPEGIAYDSVNARILAPNFGNGTVTAYDVDGNAVALGTPITGLTNPAVVAYDTGRNRIYVGTHDLGFFVYGPSGSAITVAGNWKIPPPRGNGTALPYDPTSLLIDTRGGTSFGNIYTNDVTNGGSIVVYDGEGNGVTSFSSDNGTAGLAQEPVSGRIYASWTAHNVTVFDEAGNRIAVPGTFPHTAQPNAIVYDPANGYVYTYDTDAVAFGFTNNVTAYDLNGNEIALPASFAGAANGWGMTIVP